MGKILACEVHKYIYFEPFDISTGFAWGTEWVEWRTVSHLSRPQPVNVHPLVKGTPTPKNPGGLLLQYPMTRSMGRTVYLLESQRFFYFHGSFGKALVNLNSSHHFKPT